MEPLSCFRDTRCRMNACVSMAMVQSMKGIRLPGATVAIYVHFGDIGFSLVLVRISESPEPQRGRLQ